MPLDRRDFLRTLGAASVGLAAAPALLAASGTARAGAAATGRPLPAWDAARPEAFWRAVQAQYPVTAERTYFNTGGLGPASARVLERVAATTHRLQTQVETGHELM